MREIEAKVLEVDEKVVKARLKKLNAKKISSKRIADIYFDFPGRMLEKKGMVLRLRSYGKKSFLCCKGRKLRSRMKSLEEFEVSVSNSNEAAVILKMLGFVEKLHVEKVRHSFKLNGALIELDKIAGIPLFIEIEASSERKIETIAEKLGFSRKELLPWNVFQLLAHYKKL